MKNAGKNVLENRVKKASFIHKVTFTSTLHKNLIIKDEISWRYNKRFEFKDAFKTSS